MTDTQACQVLLDRLLSGVSVSTFQIYKCLSGEDATLLKQSLKELRDQNADFSLAKKELRDYTRKLQIADMLDGRSETLSYTHTKRAIKRSINGGKTRHSPASNLSSKVDSMYEDALDILDAALNANPYLQIYLDRDFDLNAKTGQEQFSADRGGVPRLHFPFPKSHERKISALKDAVSPSKSVVAQDITIEQQQKLRSMLRNLKK